MAQASNGSRIVDAACGEPPTVESGCGYRRWVRWEELFVDIEMQFEQQLDAERGDLAVEAARLSWARRGLVERLSEHGGAVKLVLADARVVELSIDSTGADWVAGEARLGERTRGTVVPIAAIASVLPRGDQSDPRSVTNGPIRPAGLAGRLGLAFVLRDLCRRRVPIDLHTLVGIRHGTIDRVGADHLDLAEHDAGASLPAERRLRLVPLAAILCVEL